LMGMPRRIYTYDAALGLGFWNAVSTVGAYILAVGVFVYLVNLARSLANGERCDADVWDARTIEWSLPSPIPPYNFERVPHVVARDHFWHVKHGETPVQETAASTEEESDSHGIHMPDQSYFPFLAGAGMMIGAFGMLYSIALAFVGLGIVVLSIFAWAFEG